MSTQCTSFMFLMFPVCNQKLGELKWTKTRFKARYNIHAHFIFPLYDYNIFWISQTIDPTLITWLNLLELIDKRVVARLGILNLFRSSSCCWSGNARRSKASLKITGIISGYELTAVCGFYARQSNASFSMVAQQTMDLAVV